MPIDNSLFRLYYEVQFNDTVQYGYELQDTPKVLKMLGILRPTGCVTFRHEHFKDAYDELQKDYERQVLIINQIAKSAKLIYKRVISSSYVLDASKHSVAGVTAENLRKILPIIQSLVDTPLPKSCPIEC